jgi:hypothetical protein
MKSFGLLRASFMLVVVTGAMLLFAPASRAQADSEPDHFDADGVVSVTGAHPLRAAQPKQAATSKSTAANKATAAATQASGASRKPLVAQRREPAAVEDKRRP